MNAIECGARRLGATALVLGLLLSGCAPTSTDIFRPRGTVLQDSSDAQAGRERLRLAIRRGAIDKGWRIVSEEPGVTRAHVTSGGHEATVRIVYDHRSWEIEREFSSKGLKYDPDYFGREIIHFRYNHWVRGLHRSIERALASMEETPPRSSTGP